MGATKEANQDTGQVQGKRLMRNFLLDKRFQLRWVLGVALVTSLIVSIMGFFLYRTVADATDQMLAQTLGNDPVLTEEATLAYISQSARDKNAALFTLATWLIALVILLSGVTIVLTHRVAGPVYKMRKLFASIDGEHLQLWAKLRRGDELQDAFVDFERMIRRLREHRRRDIDEITSLAAVLRQADGTKQRDDVAARLEQLAAKYEASVKMD